MELTLYMSPLCPHCVAAVEILNKAEVTYTAKDITASLPYLKEFLALREDPANRTDLFKSVLERGAIGIPCFVFDDGEKCLLPEDALKKLGK